MISFNKVKQVLKSHHDASRLSVILLLISFLAYLQFNLIYDTIESFVGKLALGFSLLVLLIVSFSLYGLFVSSSLKSNFIIYVLFPLSYIGILCLNTQNIIFNGSFGNVASNIVIFILLIFHSFSIQSLKNITIKIKPSVIILITLLLFLIGTILIVGFTDEEEHKLGLYLNDCTTLQRFNHAEISCGNLLGKVIVNSKVGCSLDKVSLKNISGFFNFTLLNGSTSYQEFEDSIYFIVPPTVGRVYVQINGIYEGKMVCLSSAYSQTFATYDQYKQNKKDIATYLIALIAFILLSIPSIYKKWNDVFSE